MKSKKVKIGSIEIEIGGKVIKLKLEEAKELRDVLIDTFDKKESFPVPYIFPIPYSPLRYWDYSFPYCGSSTGASDFLLAGNSNDNTLRLTCSSVN